MISQDTADFEIKQAIRSRVGLFIGLAGGTGSGKTYSAMRMASGIVGPGKRFGVVDTENKRASHYADEFNFDVIDFPSPYSSQRYERSVSQLFHGGYGAIIVDSASHEHDGYGGYLDSQHADLDARVKRYMAKYPNTNEYQVIEKLTPSSWIEPKQHRKRMMQTLLSCSSTVPIIFCFRAEEKVFASKDGKLVARQVPEWEPICGKGLPFEMTVFFMLHHEKPGYISKAIKFPEKFNNIFPLSKRLDEEAGKRIAEWARGGVSPAVPASAGPEQKSPSEGESEGHEATEITKGQKKQLSAMMGKGMSEETKIAFFAHVAGDNPTVDTLQDFIDRFDEYKKAFVESRKEAA